VTGARFWLHWSLRDLRRRWLLVLAIALVIAIGTGMFTGLGSMETWRKRSNDASFALLNAHDLKVTLAEGSFAHTGDVRRAVSALPRGVRVTGVEERLVVPTQVDASRRGRSLLVPGALVGLDVTSPDRSIDGIAAERGRSLRPRDARSAVPVVESGFAEQAGLPTRGRISIAGGRMLRTVGQGTSPEYFLVTRPGGGEFGGAESRYAVLFVPLRTAQAASGRADVVNQLLVTLPPGADAQAEAPRLEEALERRLPQLPVTVETLADEPAHRVLHKDAEGDQRIVEGMPAPAGIPIDRPDMAV
jgi:putative ABC transport system permease protein